VGEFGDKFRKAREKKELSLDDVSNVTKISARMLQAIEQEHFDLLPGGVFNKGFIRAYAKHLGLDSEEAVTDYLTCLRQAQVDSHAGWDSEKRTAPRTSTKAAVAVPAKPVIKVQAPEDVSDELPDLQLPRAEHVRAAKKEYLGRPSSGTSWSLIAIAAAVLIASVFLWIRHTHSTRSAGVKSAPAATTVAVPSAQVAASAQTPSSSTPPVATVAASAHPSAPAMQPAANRTAAPVSPSATTADPNQVKVEKKGDVTIRSFGAAAAKPADKPAATLTLVIRASESSWISVTSDGQLVTQETLIAPAATSFHASRELVVRVGNAAGVSFLWNGEELPAQGAESEAKTLVFDAQGMRALTLDQTSH